MKNVFQFQVIQNKIDDIEIRIVPDNWLNVSDISTEKITAFLKSQSEVLNLNIKFVTEDELIHTKAGKFRPVINNISQSHNL